jgi:threonine dehydratase
MTDILDARRRIRPHLDPTPLRHYQSLSSLTGFDTWVKHENFLPTGAFKIRGGINLVSRLSEDERRRGVISASTGNHGQSIAYAARLFGVSAIICAPAAANRVKVASMEELGAEVIQHGATYDEAREHCEDLARRHRYRYVHSGDEPLLIAGVATHTVEALEAQPDLDTIIVPIGGGGLISGIAAAAKALRPGIRIVGAEPEGAATLTRSLQAGRVVTLPELSTIADGLAAKRSGDLTFEHVRSLVDDVVTVSEEEIAEGLLLMTERARLLVEPAAAVGVAATMTKRSAITFPAVVIVSGGNIDPLLLMRVVRFGMTAAGRYFSFRTRLQDRPGELQRLSSTIAGVGVNIVGIEHRREGILHSSFGDVDVSIQVELRGPDHIKELVARLEEQGYEVTPL